MDSSKYFTNIIDISKKDGKLYNLPICYSIKGIQTSPENAGTSGVGFTTAEYEKFLKGTLNGEDIISYGQAYYFAELFNNMSDRFIANGKADFSGTEFAELAKFVNDNVRERSTSWGEYTFCVGANSRDIRGTATANLTQLTEKTTKALTPQHKLNLMKQ